MSTQLPRFIALKSSNNQYLRYKHEDDETHTLLQSSGEDVLSPYVKFEVEVAQTGGGNQVHLKCCYNNKYLSCPEGSYWITANAEKSEEDHNKRSCTCFIPIITGDGETKSVRFRHVYLQRNACLWRIAPPYEWCFSLPAEMNIPVGESHDVFKVIDLEQLLVMPKYVAFKGALDDKYLVAFRNKNRNYLQFSSKLNDDETDRSKVVNEISTTGDGSIQIKSVHFNKFWKLRTPGKYIWNKGLHWIRADSDDQAIKDDTLFWPQKVNNNTVALRSLGNKKYCIRVTMGLTKSCLCADEIKISRSSHLKVEDPVTERQISDVVYHVRDAGIYNEKIDLLVNSGASNNEDNECQKEVRLSYKNIKSSKWKMGSSFKVKGTLKIKISLLPIIGVGGAVETSVQREEVIEYEKALSEERLVDSVLKVTVPGRHQVTVQASIKKAIIDVPFSYTQTDSICDYTHPPIRKHDGLYTGVFSLDFNFEHRFQKLPSKSS